MVVTVHFHALLRRQTADGAQRQLDVTMLSGSQVQDLAYDLGLGLPPGEIAWEVNGQPAQPDRILEEGDQVSLMPSSPAQDGNIKKDHTDLS